ncbi:tripartite tricarboxylate transporter permease [Sporomusa termitida]|uniref:Tripartite tricarboxylate transporter TctA family protein n=1 Tax=Sporomusa termitida TaxID=2377 RepID=A0A517E1B7_9FIRM|nr:tripartite tricarboxylate transporter permease [Sporomusa termitida]QDR83393.1 Tripartite tricarboxylate transporter TctA family protein [Sporomusa termitida]
MEAVGNLLLGFAVATTGWNLLYCLIGVTMGMFVGIMPGLGPVAGTAILVPVTFGMDPTSAIIMLAGIYYGSQYGGTITSVLINTPGESASVITCIDGYAMAKQGRAGTALGVSAIGSFIGGTAAIIGLTFIAPILSKAALRFGPPEFFSVMLLGLTMLVGLMGKSLLKGIIAALFGFLLAMVGDDPVSGSIRYSFGVLELNSGLELVAIAMGLFGVSEIMLGVSEKTSRNRPHAVKKLLPEKHEWKPTMGAIGRGTVIGFLVGLLPGANSVIASLMSYSVEKKVAQDPNRFGNGAIEGVAGPETANNACAGAANIPLFTLGIPSSPTIAILLGAFMMHGLAPGPQLFLEKPEFVWGVIASLYIGNVMLLIMNLPMARIWGKVAMVPFPVLFPLVLAFCVLGAYSINNRIFDVWVMLLFGVIGYFMKKLEFPMAATILPFVLGKPIESSFVQSLLMSGGSLSIFFMRPISLGCMIAIAAILAVSSYGSWKKKRDTLAAELE